MMDSRSGPSLSMIDSKSNIGVGNYKGVMLCNRPFGGTAVNSKQTSSGESNAFNCGVISEAIGVNVTISSKDKHKIERPKKDSVISKHRKWLADLQKQKDILETQFISDMAQKKEAQIKFADQESKLRKITKALSLEESGEKQLTAEALNTLNAQHKGESKGESKGKSRGEKGEKEHTHRAESKIESKPEKSLSHLSQTVPIGAQVREAKNVKFNITVGNNGGHRPAWALTEAVAEAASEEKEQEDEEELLNFAAELDFDKYIGDMEVRTMMDGLKNRIAEMERDMALDEKREGEREGASEERAAKREMLAQMIDDALIMGAHQERTENERDAAAARSVLQSEEGADLHAVHSNKSVTAMIKSSREKMLGESKVLHHPIVVVHSDDEGARLGKATAVANLPYMHRNPAV